ncbi:MAG: flippase-like domain-containing protein [Bacteroidetes bacterium]|nr:flippase-like domain-containing protein [Bacteroidota bacterium]MBS1631555.1 flippase-like domain-containing protein [Bacteroidota bacterium]
MKKKAITIVQYIFFFALGIFLVWWSIKDLSSTDKSQIRESLKHARYILIVPVFIILIFSHYIRALRWMLLIEPLGYSLRKSNTFFAVMIGYLTNLAFPRLGEVVRCTALARYEKVPVDKLIGTVILERIIDSITLLLIFGITLAIQPDLYEQILNTFFQSPANSETKKHPYLLLGLLVIALIVIFVAAWMIIKKKSFKDLFRAVQHIIKSIWAGIIAIQHLKKRMSFVIYTILIWVCYIGCGYIGFFALQETSQYGIKEAFTILSAGSIGVIVTPGGIGAYPVMLQKTMQLYGSSKGIGLAFGWLLWLSQTVVILVGGLLSFVALPIINKKQSGE